MLGIVVVSLDERANNTVSGQSRERTCWRSRRVRGAVGEARERRTSDWTVQGCHSSGEHHIACILESNWDFLWRKVTILRSWVMETLRDCDLLMKISLFLRHKTTQQFPCKATCCKVEEGGCYWYTWTSLTLYMPTVFRFASGNILRVEGNCLQPTRLVATERRVRVSYC